VLETVVKVKHLRLLGQQLSTQVVVVVVPTLLVQPKEEPPMMQLLD
jgi:hypothetical protein